MAVCTPSRKTLPWNLAIIPSEQSWFFYAIYQHTFPHLYSSKVCSRNCLVLTDEDEAEYRSFEASRRIYSLCWKTVIVARSMVIFFIALSIGIYESSLTEFICTNSYLQPQRSGYASYSCIKHVYLRTRTSMTCLIRYWKMSYQLHSQKDTSNNLWRRLSKHFKSN